MKLKKLPTLLILVTLFTLSNSCSHMMYHMTGDPELKNSLNRQLASAGTLRVLNSFEKNANEIQVNWEWKPLTDDGRTRLSKFQVNVNGDKFDSNISGDSGNHLTRGYMTLKVPPKPRRKRIFVKAILTNGEVDSQTIAMELRGDSDLSSTPPTQLDSPSTQSEPPVTEPAAVSDRLLGPCGMDMYNGQTIPSCFNFGGAQFSDDFNGDRLNFQKWNAQLRWDGEHNGVKYEHRVINKETQFYANINSPEYMSRYSGQNPFEISNGVLKIRATRNQHFDNNYDFASKKDNGSLDEIIAQQPFLSGAISTYHPRKKKDDGSGYKDELNTDVGFSQKHGYFEARIKFPAVAGTFPAFWLHHQPHKEFGVGTYKSEIDIVEHLGHTANDAFRRKYKQETGQDLHDYVYTSFHKIPTGHGRAYKTYDPGTKHTKPDQLAAGYTDNGQVYSPGLKFGGNWHIYSLYWTDSLMVWFIDGIEVSRLTKAKYPDVFKDEEEMYIILNLAMGGFWVSASTDGGGMKITDRPLFPTQQELERFNSAVLEVDYVYAWKLP